MSRLGGVASGDEPLCKSSPCSRLDSLMGDKGLRELLRREKTGGGSGGVAEEGLGGGEAGLTEGEGKNAPDDVLPL